MASNYDNSAPFYDQLSKIIFGKALIKAQVYLLQFIPPKSKILIVGGGTGWILEEMAKLQPSGLNITYVEISSKMTALARQKNTGENQVVFINTAIENMDSKAEFDVVITPFLFDNFSNENLAVIFKHIHLLLKTNGLWLCTDFKTTGKLWQTILLKSMYLFFKLLCNIETMHMPDIDAQFNTNGYQKLSSKMFFGQFIISSRYIKQ